MRELKLVEILRCKRVQRDKLVIRMVLKKKLLYQEGEKKMVAGQELVEKKDLKMVLKALVELLVQEDQKVEKHQEELELGKTKVKVEKAQ